MATFVIWDWLVVLLYFIAIGSIAWWAMKQKARDTTDFFLASRHVAWYVIGASIFASNIGSEHIVGLASTGAKRVLDIEPDSLQQRVPLYIGSAEDISLLEKLYRQGNAP